MTTVKELIKDLEKMPQDQYVLLNNNTDNYSISVFFTEIKVDGREMQFPGGDKKQKFVLLDQGAII